MEGNSAEDVGARRSCWEANGGCEVPEGEEELPGGKNNEVNDRGAERSAGAACRTACGSPAGVGANCPEKLEAASTAVSVASAGKSERGVAARGDRGEDWASGEPPSGREGRTGSAMSVEDRVGGGNKEKREMKALVHEP